MSKRKGVVVASIVAGLLASAQTTATTPDYKLVNAIAACDSVPCVSSKQHDVQAKIERIALYTKWLLLDPSSRTAALGLLENLPTTESDITALMILPDWHEGATQSEADMKRVAALYENWPRLLSIAVQRNPQKLPAYIRYGRLAVNDMHSDYTGFERRVCRAAPKQFVAAFHKLSTEDQTYIREHVFDPYKCKPIFVSEAE